MPAQIAPPAPPPPAPAAPPAPAKPISSMARARESMQKTAVQADLADPSPLRNAPAPAVAEASPAPVLDAPRPGAETPPAATDELEVDAPPASADKLAEDTAPVSEADKALAAQLSGKDGRKVSPWKLVKDFKERLGSAEKENLELRTKLSAAADVDKAVERAAGIEKRNTELEEEIRYVNYSKSQEYADKHQRPFEEAWAVAANDLAELDVLGEDGAPLRKAIPKDLLKLANMPLGEARRQANAMFGDSADDVMAHRRKIIELTSAQTKALEDARKSSTDRHEKATATQQAAIKETTALWSKINADIAAKHDFLKPKEGDDEWNGKLTAATKLADEAFSSSPGDSRLTSEQRNAVVAKHAAIRNRAIAYSPLKLQVARLNAQLTAAQKELAAIKGSGTVNGDADRGADGKGISHQPVSAMEAARQRMNKSAVPMPEHYL